MILPVKSKSLPNFPPTAMVHYARARCVCGIPRNYFRLYSLGEGHCNRILRTRGYLHPSGCSKNFGSGLEYMVLPDIPDVFSAVESGHCDYGVVPIENSTEGAVNRSLDLLVDSDLTIVAQVFLRVRHCLFSQSSLKKFLRFALRIKPWLNVQIGCG